MSVGVNHRVTFRSIGRCAVLRNRTIAVAFSHIKGTAITICSSKLVGSRDAETKKLSDQNVAMDFFFSLMVSPAAFAALVAALYWVYPIALLHGYKRFGGYLVAGLSRKFLTVDGIEYSYFERAGSPKTDSSGQKREPTTLLFLHGFTANKTMWMFMSKYLPKEWRIVMLDMPGHGESSFKPNNDYSALGLADKIHSFVEASDLKDFHLLGLSLGALVSAAYATQHGDRIASLTVMCPPGLHRLPNGVKTKFFEALEKGKNYVMPTNADEFQDMMELVLYNPKTYTFHQRMREALVQIQKPNYAFFHEIQEDLLQGEEDAEFITKLSKKITMPTLILWGDHDRVCHPSGAKILNELVKGSEMVMVENCGHCMTMDRPRKCAKLVKDFIEKQNPPPATEVH